MTFPFPTFSPVDATTTAEYTGSGLESPGGSLSSPRTFAGVSVGSADAGRHVVSAIMLQRTSGSGSPVTGVTIGGVTATKIGSTGLSGHTLEHVAEFWIAAVPTGTTADVTVAFTGTIFRWAASLFKVLGYSSVHNSATAGTLSANAVSASINGRANGCIIACVLNNGVTSYTWTNLTERYDGTAAITFSAASDNFATAQTALSITATQAANNSPQCIAIVSL